MKGWDLARRHPEMQGLNRTTETASTAGLHSMQLAEANGNEVQRNGGNEVHTAAAASPIPPESAEIFVPPGKHPIISGDCGPVIVRHIPSGGTDVIVDPGQGPCHVESIPTGGNTKFYPINH
jgi:hypothetical protein